MAGADGADAGTTKEDKRDAAKRKKVIGLVKILLMKTGFQFSETRFFLLSNLL
jgi:hypothetical protein